MESFLRKNNLLIGCMCSFEKRKLQKIIPLVNKKLQKIMLLVNKKLQNFHFKTHLFFYVNILKLSDFIKRRENTKEIPVSLSVRSHKKCVNPMKTRSFVKRIQALRRRAGWCHNSVLFPVSSCFLRGLGPRIYYVQRCNYDTLCNHLPSKKASLCIWIVP